MTNKDRVSMLFGKGVADTLDEEGLIRPDAISNLAITHWKVIGRIGKVIPTMRPAGNLRTEFAYLIHEWMYHQTYGTVKPVRTSAEVLLGNELTARRLVTAATKAGLDVRLVPMILVEAGTR